MNTQQEADARRAKGTHVPPYKTYLFNYYKGIPVIVALRRIGYKL